MEAKLRDTKKINDQRLEPIREIPNEFYEEAFLLGSIRRVLAILAEQVNNCIGAITNSSIGILLLLSKAHPIFAQSTNKEEKTPTITNTMVALITMIIYYCIAHKITSMSEDYLANSDTEEEDSSKEEDTMN